MLHSYLWSPILSSFEWYNKTSDQMKSAMFDAGIRTCSTGPQLLIIAAGASLANDAKYTRMYAPSLTNSKSVWCHVNSTWRFCSVERSRLGLFSFSLLPFHMLHRRAKSPWVWLDRSDVVKEHPSTQTVKNRTLILMRQCRWLQWTDVKYFDRLWVGAAVQRTNCCWQYHFNNVQRRELVIFTGYSAILLSAELL